MANFDPNAGRAMDLASARKWTAAYQAEERKRTGNPNPVKAHAFGVNKINELMKGASGLRIYPGYDSGGNVHMILVALDAQGHDILNVALGSPDAVSNEILQYSSTCPPDCDSLESKL